MLAFVRIHRALVRLSMCTTPGALSFPAANHDKGPHLLSLFVLHPQIACVTAERVVFGQ